MGEASRQVAIRDLLNQVRDQFPNPQQGRIIIEAHAEVSVTIPKQATIQSIAALIQNALDASRDDRPVRLSAYESGAHMRIAIEDEGCGMTETVFRRVGEPFFTTKEPGKGMGLGTFLVRTFAERLGGRLSFDSVAGRGTTATLELPMNAMSKNEHAAV